MSTVKGAHTGILAAKRKELADLIDQCIAAVKEKANGDSKADSIVQNAETYFTGQKDAIANIDSIALLDGKVVTYSSSKDTYCQQIENALKPAPEPAQPSGASSKKIKPLFKTAVFQAKVLNSDAEIDEYVESLRAMLKAQLNGFDAIELK